ncbi:hypothetical protein ACQCN2_04885 [Brevibacillus ginsengisoli]|uniref:hypothetical protein n=1 Tax=Brevibacillus ginsengisoli TaxID=363854 RepID=UPI003CF117B6
MKKVAALVLFACLFSSNVYANSEITNPPSVSVPTVTKSNGVTIEKATTYVKSLTIKNGKLYGTFDYVEWYFGDNAQKAYQKDCPKCSGYDGKGHIPSMYYIRNHNKKLRTYPIAQNAEVVLQTNSLGKDGNFQWNEKVNMKTFQQFAQKRGIPYNLPFHIEVKNGVVTKITEQYIP